MAFPPPTYILQQQAGHPPDFLQPDFSYLSVPSAQSYEPISVGQNLAASQLHSDVQTLKRQIDSALRTIREHENTIVHQATFIRQSSNPRRTQHGIICPDCKQEVAHTCSHSLITSSSRYEHPPSSALANLTGLQRHFTGPTAQGNLFDGCITTNSTSSTSQVQPLPSSSNTFISRYYPPTSITLGSPAGVQTHFADLTVQGNLFGEQVTARSVPAPFESSISHFRPPPPNSSDIFSTFMSDPYSVPRLSFSSPSGATSSFPPFCPPGSSSAVHSQYTSNKNNLWLGKRYLRSPDLECEPERKRTRQDLPERRSTNQQSESNDSQRLRLPPIEDSFPLFANTSSASEAVMSPSVPGTPATTSEDSSVISEPESVADWSITYNTEVERELDVTMVRTLEVEPIRCLRFSKDGKHLAVGFYGNNGTTLYDVETGEKTCILRSFGYGEDGKGKDHVCAVCFSPDGLYLVTGGTDPLICIWEISKKRVRNVLSSPKGHWYIDRVDFSPNGRLIAIGTLGARSFQIWNWRDGFLKIFERVESPINGLHFSPDSQYIAVAIESGVLIWNVHTSQMVGKLMTDSRVLSVAFMPDGKGLVSGSEDRTVRYWDIRMEVMESGEAEEVLTFSGHESWVGLVAVSSNSRWVVSCAGDGGLRFWNVHNADLHCELRPCDYVELDKYRFFNFDFSPVSGCLAVSCEGGRVFLWKLKQVLD